jgi:hypothetical protein
LAFGLLAGELIEGETLQLMLALREPGNPGVPIDEPAKAGFT